MKSRPRQPSNLHDSNSSLRPIATRGHRLAKQLAISQGTPLNENNENYLMINQLQNAVTRKSSLGAPSRLRVVRDKVKSISTSFKSDLDWRETDTGRFLSNCTPIKSSKTQIFKIRELKTTLEKNRLLIQNEPWDQNLFRVKSSQRQSLVSNPVKSKQQISESFLRMESSSYHDYFVQNNCQHESKFKLESGNRQSFFPLFKKSLNKSHGRNHIFELALNPSINSQQPKSNPMISKARESTYNLQHVIGKGSYALVYQAQDRYDKSIYAVKVYSKAKMASNTRKKIVENEIEVLKSISHENIVKLFKTSEDDSEIHLIMELIKGMSMGNWVKSFPGSAVSEQMAKPHLKKLLNAIAFLHNRNICHRDLKLDNIIITQDSNLKLIDFGFACIESGLPNLGLFCGTPNYMAPEIISKVPYKGSASDCWAFGVLFFRVIVGSFPFQNPNTSELKKNILSLNYAIPKTMSADARKVIEALLVHSPTERATLQQIKSFKFFN
jgi:tRNA A-37 threonylcarbamoyl transferase component Bud32